MLPRLDTSGSLAPKGDHHLTKFTIEEAADIGTRIGINWDEAPFSVEEFHKGLGVELEHGERDAETNVTSDDPLVTGKIALAHLNEFPDYYQRLERMEREAEDYWDKN
jgi:hypothetical protein